MKKIIGIISIVLCLFTSCQTQEKEAINIFVSSNIELLMKEIVTTYERYNHKVKINITTDKSIELDKLDIIISENEDIFLNNKINENKNENENKTQEKQKNTNKKVKNEINENSSENSYKEKFEEASDFATDNIVIIGKRKLNSLDELLYSSISSPNYENTVGKFFIDNLSKLQFFNEISKKINYVNDTISAMQATELYEADFAIINTLLLSNVKNSIICYSFSANNQNNEIKNEENITESLDTIIYKKYLKKESPEAVQNFYNFLTSPDVKKIVNKHKIIS